MCQDFIYVKKKGLGQIEKSWNNGTYIFGHDGNAFGVNGAQIGIFKQTDEVGFGSFLQGHNSWALKSEICFEILGNFTYQTLKRQFANQ